MQYWAELDIPFPAALNRAVQQKEEEAREKKLEEQKLLPLLLTRKKEGEKEKILDEDDYFSSLFREEEAASANIACGVHHKRRQKKKRKKKKKMDAMLRIKEEGEKEENLQISPCSPHLHKLKDKEFTSSDSDFLLHEVLYIATGQHQPNAQQLLEEEEEAEELELLLQATQNNHEQQLEDEKEKKELEAFKDLTLLEGEQAIAALTCEDLDILEQEADYLLQHSSSSKEQGEEHQISPYSLQLRRVKEKDVEDFTESDVDYLLLEENPTKAGQHPFREEMEAEEEQKEAMTPDLQGSEATELQQPQATTPRQKEAAEYPFNFPCLSSEFELTLNHFLLSLKLFISGDRLQEQQLPLQVIYKLHLNALLGEVHKKGTKGDGVPWFIKVHPP